MSLQNILQKIIEESQKQIAIIEKETQKKEQILIEESKKEETNDLQKIANRLNEEKEKLIVKMQATVRRTNRRNLLLTKTTLLEKTLNNFLHSLEKTNDDMYFKIIQKLLDQLPFSSGKLLVPLSKESVFKKIVTNDFSIQTDSRIVGGFVFQGDGVEIDNSFRNLVLFEYKDVLEMKISQELKLV